MIETKTIDEAKELLFDMGVDVHCRKIYYSRFINICKDYSPINEPVELAITYLELLKQELRSLKNG